jgi:hypothetical protein
LHGVVLCDEGVARTGSFELLGWQRMARTVNFSIHSGGEDDTVVGSLFRGDGLWCWLLLRLRPTEKQPPSWRQVPLGAGLLDLNAQTGAP